MVYLNFNKITPPAPNDPTVDEVEQLNDNWDVLDTKLAPYISGGAVNDLETGQEVFASGFRFAVWDGTTARVPDDIDAGWSAWTALPILAPRVARGSFTPRWRNNSAYRMVELAGGVLFDAAAAAWTMGSLFTVNSDTSGAIPSSMQPIAGSHISPCAVGLPTSPALVATGYISVDKPGGNTFTRVRAQYMGGPGGGNFLMLDQVWWWY